MRNADEVVRRWNGLGPEGVVGASRAGADSLSLGCGTKCLVRRLGYLRVSLSSFGIGVFAGRAFRKGERICTFGGEVISLDEAAAKGAELREPDEQPKLPTT